MSAKESPLSANSGGDDLHDYARPAAIVRRERPARSRRAGRQPWKPTITDDWPDRIPVSEAELDVFEAHFGDLLDELFAAKD